MATPLLDALLRCRGDVEAPRENGPHALDEEPCLEQVEDRPGLELSWVGVGEQDAPLRVANIHARAVPQLDDAERLELPEGLAHSRRSNGKSPCERLHRRQPVAATERLTL